MLSIHAHVTACCCICLIYFCAITIRAFALFSKTQLASAAQADAMEDASNGLLKGESFLAVLGQFLLVDMQASRGPFSHDHLGPHGGHGGHGGSSSAGWGCDLLRFKLQVGVGHATLCYLC